MNEIVDFEDDAVAVSPGSDDLFDCEYSRWMLS